MLRRRLVPLVVSLLTAAGAVAAPGASAGTPTVWRVGTYDGVPGNVRSIAAALAKARPGDWILIAPGVYHPGMDASASQRGSDHPAGILITTPGLHIRGMDRNQTVLDGTKRGSPTCSSAAGDQNFGVPDSSGQPSGRNGIEVYKTDGVTIDNLTVCNFLTGSQGSGNEIWWNGGDDSGTIGMGSWRGSYLTATSTYYDPAHPDVAALYGIFVSNARGPGLLTTTYASNFADSGYYVGACPDCNAVLARAHAQNNALGYSGTNSGGRLAVVDSEFDHNKDGFDTNSQNSADAPSPQDGSCPHGVVGPLGTGSCWVFAYNYVHDNNNPNVPLSGEAGNGPVGTGISIAGGRHDTIYHNTFARNGSWAVLLTVFPDTGRNASNCSGGVPDGSFLGITVPCLYDVFANEVADNTFQGNGFFGNQTNGDLADLATAPAEAPGAAGDCFHGNRTPGGAPATSWPLTLQTTQGTCGLPVYPDPASTAALGVQVLCNTQQFGPCPVGVVANYPRQTHVAMRPLALQRTMPHPCDGVPANAWCGSGGSRRG